MGHCAQTFFGNEFARDAADAVGLVFNAHESGLQSLDELLLSGRQVGPRP